MDIYVKKRTYLVLLSYCWDVFSWATRPVQMTEHLFLATFTNKKIKHLSLLRSMLHLFEKKILQFKVTDFYLNIFSNISIHVM